MRIYLKPVYLNNYMDNSFLTLNNYGWGAGAGVGDGGIGGRRGEDPLGPGIIRT